MLRVWDTQYLSKSGIKGVDIGVAKIEKLLGNLMESQRIPKI